MQMEEQMALNLWHCLKTIWKSLGWGAQTIETCTTPNATMGSVAANPVGGNELRLLGEAMTQMNKNGE
jgi:hypothetical protein